MALEIPSSAKEVEQRSKTDVQRELPGSNPFLKNSAIGAIVVAFANRIFDFYIQLKETIKQLFPDTTQGEFLERWAAIFGKIRLAATTATGNIVATGTSSSNIPLGTNFVSSSGNIYASTASTNITNQVIGIIFINRTGSTASVITAGSHKLSNNVQVTISGAIETEYNGTFSIVVTGDNTFTYTVTGSPSTPASGAISAAHTSASVPVQSEGFGKEFNLDAGSPLTLQSPVVGIDDQLQVDFGTLGGGTDQEIDDALRARMLERIQNPVSHFNVSDIIQKAKEVAGVTRVFVQEVTPAIGQVTIYFMRDNDTDPIPSGSEVQEVKDSILTIKPANTADADVIVNAPTPVNVDFTFSALTPNTTSMLTAVTANLTQFFAEQTFVGTNIDEDAYRSAIKNTVDPETGDIVQTFSLIAPIGDITINAGEIGVLDNVVLAE